MQISGDAVVHGETNSNCPRLEVSFVCSRNPKKACESGRVE